MASLNPKYIVGKTVARVDLRPFPDGKGSAAHDPVIWFTDGSHVTFSTEETETGEYGVAISYWKANR